jgi:hypothetical protein
VVKSQLGHEDPKEFEALLADLKEDRQPVGTLEEMLVEQIALSFWRLARAGRCEAGEIGKQLESAENELTQDRRSASLFALIESGGTLIHFTLHQLQEMSDVLSEATDQLRNSDRIADYTLHEICRWTFPDRAQIVVSEHEKLKKSASQQPVDKEQHNAVIVLNAFVRMLKNELQKKQFSNVENVILAASLPSGDVLDRILRYRITIERHLERSLNQLERLQMRRNGSAVVQALALQIGS